MEQTPPFDLAQPRWDQSTYIGRAKHFFTSTDPRNVLASDAELEHAKAVVQAYRNKAAPQGLTADEIWRAKTLYDSAFHPQTGEKLFLPGRMSFQVPGNMIVTGCMMAFSRTTPAVFFWQWANQSFNAVVNYTNRNPSAPVSDQDLMKAYVGATSSAVAVALGLNSLVKMSPRLSGSIVARLVPWCAVAAANCVNLPLMRQMEIKDGIFVQDKHGNDVGKSSIAAKKAIREVVMSRIIMATPGMVLPPAFLLVLWRTIGALLSVLVCNLGSSALISSPTFVSICPLHNIVSQMQVILSRLEKRFPSLRNPRLNAVATVAVCGLCLVFATPLACAIFPQMSSLALDELEPELREDIQKKYGHVDRVYFNKGL